MAQKSRDQSLRVAASASEVRKVPNSETCTDESSVIDASEDVVKRVRSVLPHPNRQKERARQGNKRVLYLAAITEHRNIKHLEELKRRAGNDRPSHGFSQRDPKEHLAHHDAYDRTLRGRRTPRRHEPDNEAQREREARAVERRRPHKYEAGSFEGPTRNLMSSGRHHKDERREEKMRTSKDAGGLIGLLRNMISSRRLHLKEETEEDRETRREDRRHLRTSEAERNREARRAEARRPRRQHEDPEQERDSHKHRDQDRPSTRNRSRHGHHRRRLEGEDRRVKDEEREAQRVAGRVARRVVEENRLGKHEREASRVTRGSSSRESIGASFDTNDFTSTCTDERQYPTQVESPLEEEANKRQEMDREAARALRNDEIRKLEEERKVVEQKAMVQAAERILAEEAAKQQAEEARRLQEEEKLAEERARKEAGEKETEAGLFKKADTLAEEMEKQLAEERAKKRAEEREKVARRFKEEREKKVAEEKLRLARERAKQRAEQKTQAEEEAKKQAQEKDKKARQAVPASYRQLTTEEKHDARNAEKEKAKAFITKKKRPTAQVPTTEATEPQEALSTTFRQSKLGPTSRAHGAMTTFGAQRLPTPQESENSSSSDDEIDD
ncbi:hypothetical protein ACHAPU_006341 [Fusarium lateritium]